MKLRLQPRRLATSSVIVVFVVVAFVAATLISQRLFRRPGAAPVADPAVADRAAERALRGLAQSIPGDVFRVAALQGGVECERGGRRYVVQAGDLLSRQDIVRTTAGARALLRRGPVELELQENLDVRLDEVELRAAEFGVLRGSGQVVATVTDGAERLAITAERTRSQNQNASRWIVALDGNGQVSVAVARGQVAFAAAGRSLDVTAGQESTATAGLPPSAPAPIPEELLLSVIWPETAAAAVVPVRGRVQRSTRVAVNGTSVPVAPDGTWKARVPLPSRTGTLQVEARDVLGRRKVETRTLGTTPAPVPAPPALEREPEELWKR